MSEQPGSRRATIAVQLYAPSMMCPNEHSRRHASVKLKIPNGTRPLSRKGSIQEKFANSYSACVSSPESYRRKRPNVSNESNKFADVEKELLQNIHECRRALDEHNERLQSQQILINIPVMRAVSNLVLLDQARNLRLALKTWKKFTYAMRQKEHESRITKKLYRIMGEDIVKDWFESASKSASLILSESHALNESTDAGRTNSPNIQKWRRSRSKHNTTCLEGGTADGRVSHFNLPAPNLSRYTPVPGSCHRKQTQRIEKEVTAVTAKDMESYWKAAGSRQASYKLSNGLFVDSLASEPRQNKGSTLELKNSFVLNQTIEETDLEEDDI